MQSSIFVFLGLDPRIQRTIITIHEFNALLIACWILGSVAEDDDNGGQVAVSSLMDC